MKMAFTEKKRKLKTLYAEIVRRGPTCAVVARQLRLSRARISRLIVGHLPIRAAERRAFSTFLCTSESQRLGWLRLAALEKCSQAPSAFCVFDLQSSDWLDSPGMGKAKRQTKRSKSKQYGMWRSRRTGIFRDFVPADEKALVAELLGKDKRGFIAEDPRPGNLGPPAAFLRECQRHKQAALAILKKYGMHRLPWGEEFGGQDGFERWLEIPPEVAEAWMMVLLIDQVIETLNRPPWRGRMVLRGRSWLSKEKKPKAAALRNAVKWPPVGWLSMMGRQALEVSATRVEKVPAGVMKRLSRELGENHLLDLLSEALRIGRLAERLQVRLSKTERGRGEGLRKARLTAIEQRQGDAHFCSDAMGREMDEHIRKTGHGPGTAARILSEQARARPKDEQLRWPVSKSSYLRSHHRYHAKRTPQASPPKKLVYP